MDPNIPPTIQNEIQNNPTSPVPPVKAPIAEGRCFLTWLLYAIISPLGGFLLGLVFGGILGAILGAIGVNIETIQVIGGIVGFLLGNIFSFVTFRFLVVRMILDWVLAPR